MESSSKSNGKKSLRELQKNYYTKPVTTTAEAQTKIHLYNNKTNPANLQPLKGNYNSISNSAKLFLTRQDSKETTTIYSNNYDQSYQNFE